MSERSSRPFPVQGGRATDGIGLDPSTIPHWLAQIVYNQMCKAAIENGRLDCPTLAEVEKAGGFIPGAMLDLLAGGNGTGLMSARLYKRKTTLLAVETPLQRIGIVKKVNGV